MGSETIRNLRRIMGTLPEEQPKRTDEIYVGVENIKVELVDYPKNPYKAIYEIVTSTWGGRDRWFHRWKDAPVEGRIKVVLAALEGKTLPQCLEAPSFTFKIQGLSRSAYDQLARHRYSGIGSVGMRDNNWRDAALRIPSDLLRWKSEIAEWWKKTKDLYDKIVSSGQASWQSARAILPMGTCWRFTWTMNYRALQGILAQRMAFCEQYDTVYTAWAMWAELRKKFPLLAVYCRPRCDIIKKCYYSDIYSLSILFGALFKPCGRWPVKKYWATFPNLAAADPDEIDRELRKNYGFGVPSPNEWDKLKEEALQKDRKFFEEE